MKYVFVLWLLLLTVGVNKIYCQDNYEIQVYGSATQNAGSTMFELHSNYTIVGQKNTVDGVLPSNHALHETLEITTGITANFELGIYLFTNYNPQNNFQIVGTHIRPRISAPQSWHLPVGLSLSAELGTQKAAYANDIRNLELRPIIDKQWAKWYISFNPTFGVSLKSTNTNNSIPVFEPNLKIAYKFRPAYNLGIEYFSGLGAINQFETLSQQQHALFAVFDLLQSKNWELNFGTGYDFANVADKWVVKMYCGRRINWR